MDPAQHVAKKQNAMTLRKLTQHGFTLAELMIVVAIVSILAAVALPLYKNYTIRAKVVELLLTTDAAKTAIWDKYATDGYSGFAPGYAAVYTFRATPIMASGSINDTDATIVVIGTDAAGNTPLTLQPTINDDGALHWQCSTELEYAQYVPSNCR
jgi:type IV pilus assembly protein PilA